MGLKIMTKSKNRPRNFLLLHILKDDGMLNETSPEAVRSVIQADGHFTFICLFTATRAAAAGIATAGAMTVDHFGGFVFVAAMVVA
jgi:hypothetical protein